MFVFPPCDGEALADVSEKVADQVVVGAVLEHLVVEKVVGQPSALLPKGANEDGRKEGRKNVLGVKCEEGNSGDAQGKSLEDVASVPDLARLVPSRTLNQGTKFLHVLSETG